MEYLKDQRIVVAGLGKFGGQIAAAKWLVAQGARVLVTDRSPAERLAASVKDLDGLPIEFRLGEHRDEDFTSADLIVASPAIPPHNPFLAAAREAGVPVTTEIRLFIERCPTRKIVGVTGTKGKSTTTALLGRMLATKFTTHVGGNIGKPLLLDLDKIKTDDVVVLELSSFMLEYLRDLQWSPHVAVVTMLSADHLDWHGSVDNYLDAKKLIVKHQRSGDVAVLAAGGEHTAELRTLTRGRVVTFSADGSEKFELKIPGWHNQFNCQAAWTAAREMGVTFDDAQRAVRDFPGLPHRLHLVHDAGGVRWFNDSIATIPDAAVAALDSFPPRTVIQIVGGSSKGLDFTPMAQALAERAKAVLCIGKTGPEILRLAKASTTPRRAAVHDCGDLVSAVAQARSLAKAGDVVLLSTGCASYDQFDNFEQRGETFAEYARSDATATSSR
jgi:UDP-N-acetylmuramoylalanine--D-glutamate ligase